MGIARMTDLPWHVTLIKKASIILDRVDQNCPLRLDDQSCVTHIRTGRTNFIRRQIIRKFR